MSVFLDFTSLVRMCVCLCDFHVLKWWQWKEQNLLLTYFVRTKNNIAFYLSDWKYDRSLLSCLLQFYFNSYITFYYFLFALHILVSFSLCNYIGYSQVAQKHWRKSSGYLIIIIIIIIITLFIFI